MLERRWRKARFKCAELVVLQSLTSLMSERSDLIPRLGLLSRDAELTKKISLLAYDYGFQLSTLCACETIGETTDAPQFDLVMVDLAGELPGEAGVCEVLHQCVELTGLPTVALSSQADEETRLGAFEAGAIDYIQMPMSARELATRILRILSRTNPALFIRPLTHGNILMDVAREKTFCDGRYIELNEGEFKLLHALLQRPQQVHTRKELLSAVFGEPDRASARTIDVYVLRLRQALSSPEPGSIIRTVRAIGYSLDKDAASARK